MCARRNLSVPPARRTDSEVPFVEGAAGNTTPCHHEVPASNARNEGSVALPDLGVPFMLRHARAQSISSGGVDRSICPASQHDEGHAHAEQNSVFSSQPASQTIQRLRIAQLLYPSITDTTNYTSHASTELVYFNRACQLSVQWRTEIEAIERNTRALVQQHPSAVAHPLHLMSLLIRDR
jgi:hypothetical protein